MVTALPLRSMSLAVTARLLKALVAPTVPPSTTLPPLAVTVSARGVAEALLTVVAIVITALLAVADSAASAPSVTASP